jgi:hypothetical protein
MEEGIFFEGNNLGWIQEFSVRFELFTAVTMKNAVLWDVTPCGHKSHMVSHPRGWHSTRILVH